MAHMRSPGEQLQVFSFFGAGFFFSGGVSVVCGAGFSGAGFSATGAGALSLLAAFFACDVPPPDFGGLATATLVVVSFGASAAAAVPVAGG